MEGLQELVIIGEKEGKWDRVDRELCLVGGQFK